MVKTDSLQRKLESKLIQFFKSEGYESDEIDDSLFRIVIEPHTKDQYTDVYIYAEIDIDEFFNVSNSWNSVITALDPSAYFDVVSPGVYMARLYWSTVSSQENSSNVLTSQNLTKFANTVAYELEDEYGDEFFVDDVNYDKKSQRLSITVSSFQYESTASIKLYAYDLDDYDDLINMYQDKVVKSLKKRIREI